MPTKLERICDIAPSVAETLRGKYFFHYYELSILLLEYDNGDKAVIEKYFCSRRPPALLQNPVC